ncbi:MAG: peptidyl-prolyl cis-trans isomerase [Candidatus Omnitrophota bacterium]
MKIRILITLALLSIGVYAAGAPTVIEKIYAVVNGEMITYTDLKSTEIQMTGVLSQEYKGNELQNKIEEMKKSLLDRMIEQKVLLSFAKDKNYNVDGELELIIKNVKKENNLNSDDELKQALTSQGLNFEEWKQQARETQMQRHYIDEMIGSKIKIDSSAIMEYYKKNIQNYTLPAKVSLNCIFLNKSNYPTPDSLQEKMKAIDAELAASKFEDTAKKYTELPDKEIFLGEFKQGDLDPALEKSALGLKKGEHSGWIETKAGWYALQLTNKVESQFMEYKSVRDDIEGTLRQEEENKKMKDFIQDLKKDSHIKIYEKW